MVGSNSPVNKFLDSIKENLAEQQDKDPAPVSHIVINRAVRCTIIVGNTPEPNRTQPSRARRKG